ncbi:Amidohydrolase 2 [Artemisia annua]|uniref:Amidohydrolase 2 n=1 Tax=Artemisia annua TaxID=35608 RepID=A0A2U1Q7I5_ARTAN|nr:Amidohydrolase 2 [Artemisia annua]
MTFKAAGISALLIDDGLQLDKMLVTAKYRDFVPFVGRILTIESLAEEILDQNYDYDVKVVGLKSIAAYRGGLDINTNVTTKEVEEGLAEVLLAANPVRITNKNLVDYIFMRSLEAAVSFDWPMLIHTGFGDKDLDLRQANPLHLHNVLEDPRFLDCRIVLLHASYPFSKEASYLASVYHQVKFGDLKQQFSNTNADIKVINSS